MAAVIKEKKMGIREFISTGFLLFSLFFLITLLTFNPEDGGWTHSGLSAIPKNAGGMIGAWISDLIFSLFGVEAYLFPLIFCWRGYLFYKPRPVHENSLIIILRWLGALIALAAGTVLFYLHIPRLGIDLPNGSGGILGQEIGDALLLILTESSTTVLNSSIFMLGLSFFSGLSLFSLIDGIGRCSLWLLSSTTNTLFTEQITQQEPLSEASILSKKKLVD
jgi:S-DNA-T family DNA segregation ATPase FtsK/SpoIIIE